MQKRRKKERKCLSLKGNERNEDGEGREDYFLTCLSREFV